MSLGKSLLMSDTESNIPFENVTSSESVYPYRVRVCLKKYFTDERALAYVMVSSRRRVSWLEQRLRQLFGLRGPFRLTSRGHLLPSAEQLAILRPDELVDVIPTTNEKDDIPNIKNCNTGQEKTNNYCTEKTENEIYIANASPPSINSDVDPIENGESDSHLEKYKKQALAMLEQKYSELNQDGIESENNVSEFADDAFAVDLPARKRRRVRHRKRTSRGPNNTEGPGEESASAGVQRNRAASPRAPRLVHAA